MIEILTAEEYIKKHPYIDSFLSSAQGYEVLQTFMINFAKLHVEVALEKAYHNAELKEKTKGDMLICYTFDEMEGAYVLDKDSILNAYPLTNIK